MGDDLMKLSVLFIGVAFAALLIGHASQTGQLIQAGTGGFDTLLNTVELGGAGTTSGLSVPGGAGGSNPVQQITGSNISSGGLPSMFGSLGGF
jgi:hypothetical protein